MCKHDQAARTAIVSTHAHDAAATASTTTWCHPPTVHHTTTSSSQHSAHPHSAPRTKAGLRPAEAEAGGRPADLPAGHPSTFHVTRLRCARLEPELSVIGTHVISLTAPGIKLNQRTYERRDAAHAVKGWFPKTAFRVLASECPPGVARNHRLAKHERAGREPRRRPLPARRSAPGGGLCQVGDVQ